MDNPFTPEMFDRIDESDDTLFYAFPRKVVHIDDPAIAAVGRFMAQTFPPDGVLLDLMSSWRSHLLAGFIKQRLIGLGLNAEEMADNPDLDEYVVQNLNAVSRLPFADNYFDGVMVTVSVQYLIRPLEIFGEVRRVLKPGAPFIVFFSNRMFPTKAVRIWQVLRDEQRAELVRTYFRLAGGYDEAVFHDLSPNPGVTDPLYVVWARKSSTQVS
ncbi:MAG TPA: methyltransferase domain-containing protein [Methylomirabilota bacterium]|jgi:SAM-dependent methyltransferase|nr:methyltransferase domain-containing protein [Methylomirabilota bacterium]